MENLQKLTFFLLILLLFVNQSIFSQPCTQFVEGTIKNNSQVISGAEVYIRIMDIYGSYSYSDVVYSNASGIYSVCDIAMGPNDYSKQVIATLPCPYGTQQIQNFITNTYVYNFNFTTSTPTVNGSFSGTASISGSGPVPYHSIIKHYLPNGTNTGYAQTYNNNGTYSYSTTGVAGTHRLNITVYTQPTITVRDVYFCLNTSNQSVNPSISISGFQKGYATGEVVNSCEPVASAIVYFKPYTPNGMAQGYVVTNSLGEYTSYYLPAGTYTFWTTYSGQTKSRTVTITSGQKPNMDFVFGDLCDEENPPESTVEDMETLDDYKLFPNYPNPFNPTTNIRFNLVESGHVRLTIYNMMGEEVKTLIQQELSAGLNDVIWDGTDKQGNHVSSGNSIYTLLAGNKRISNKMILLK